MSRAKQEKSTSSPFTPPPLIFHLGNLVILSSVGLICWPDMNIPIFHVDPGLNSAETEIRVENNLAAHYRQWQWTSLGEMEGEHRYVDFTLINPPGRVQLCAGTSTRRQPWERFTLISSELWDGSSSQRRKAERPPARKVRPLQGRRSFSWERSRYGWRQEDLLLLQLALPMPALLHLLARTMPAGIQLLLRFPQPGFPPWLRFICRKGQGWEEQSLPQAEEGEQPFLLGHRARNCPPMSFSLLLLLTGHQGYKGANEVLRTLRIHRLIHRWGTWFCFSLVVSQAPVKMPCKAPEAAWQSGILLGTGGDGSISSCPSKCPGNQGVTVKGIQGKQERFGSLVCCSALCKVVVLALPPFFPCLLDV